MDPAPPSVGERFPVLISSMHQTAEEVTHTHRSAAQQSLGGGGSSLCLGWGGQALGSHSELGAFCAVC